MCGILPVEFTHGRIAWITRSASTNDHNFSNFRLLPSGGVIPGTWLTSTRQVDLDPRQKLFTACTNTGYNLLVFDSVRRNLWQKI
jgi:hypothetical protein